MKKAIIYTRVSTDEQADRGYSLGHQEDQLRKYCEVKQIEIVEHFQDDASAKTFNRPQFQRAVEFIRKNKRQVDHLLFIKWDRFSRNISEAYKMIDSLAALGVDCNAIDQWLDLTIPENKLLLAIYLATPEIENDRRSLNTRAGMRKAMRVGRWVSTPPKGYKMGRDEQNKPLMFATADAAFIKEGFEIYSTGLYSKCEVRKVLEKKGFKMGRSQFFATLRNPLYYGKIFIPAYKDEEEVLVNGLHQPIIDEELFHKCQRVDQGTKRNMQKPNAKNAALPLRGHLICKECGNTLTGSGSLGNGGKYFYYHCQHGCKERFRADDAHSSFENYISSFKVEPEIASLYLAVIEDVFIKEEGARQRKLQKLEGEIAGFRSKLLKTDDMFIAGDLEKDSYKRMKDHYCGEMSALQERKKEMEGMDTAFSQYMKWGFSLLLNFPEYYGKAPLEIKQKMVSSIFPEKLVFENGTYRTIRANEVLSLLCSNNRGFSKKTTGQEIISDNLSSLAPRAGLEPATL